MIEVATRLARLLGRPTWTLDQAVRNGRELRASGWVAGRRRGVETLRIGSAVVPLERHHRQDIAELFWFLDSSDTAGFHVTVDAGTAEEELDLRVDFCVDDQPLENLSYFVTSRVDRDRLPPPELRRRVHGHESPDGFVLEGYSTFRKLDEVLRHVTGRGLAGYPTVLDWGCGCGRVARYFDQISDSVQVVGIDIDADGPKWCAENLGFGSFSATATHPPAPVESSSIDLVIGVSVMTHLRREDQQVWLAELSRLLRPGGIACLTTHGLWTLLRSGLDRSFAETFLLEGFVDAGLNPNLLDSQVPENYYANVLTSVDFLRREWTAHFEIVAIVEGAIGNHQDIVVLRRPD